MQSQIVSKEDEMRIGDWNLSNTFAAENLLSYRILSTTKKKSMSSDLMNGF